MAAAAAKSIEMEASLVFEVSSKIASKSVTLAFANADSMDCCCESNASIDQWGQADSASI